MEVIFTFNKMSLDGALFDLAKVCNICKEMIAKMSTEEVSKNVLDYAKEYDEELYSLINRNYDYFKQIMSIEREIEKPRKDYEKYSDVKNAIIFFYSDYYDNLVKEIKKECSKPIIVKLSPNVTDIVAMAKAVEKAGADAISLINTLVGMRIDLKTAKPIISIKKGGYSGPGIFPVALRMVYEVSHAVNIPIIGMGGIATAYDVLEMMYAGASLVMIGAQNLVDPYVCKKIIDDLPNVMKEYNIENLQDIIGRSM